MAFARLESYLRQPHYPQLPDMKRLVQISIPSAANQVYAFLCTKKEWALGGVAVAAIVFAVAKYFRSLPEFPFAEMRTSQNCAVVTIGMAKREASPLKVNLVFCVDTSGSMSENGCLSESQVKEGISAVLDSALKVASAVKGTQIGIAIIGFNSQSRVICEPREINSTSVSEIKSKLQSYKSEGQTKIISGFDHATKTLESMARQNRKAVQVLVLLTDGEEGNVSKSDVASIHTRLAAIKAKLFAIGIGVNHKKETLRLIAPTGGKFTGTYIDTAVEGQSIVKAISTVYQQAIASFSQLVLVSSQLVAGTWSVDGELSVEAGEESKCELGVLSEGKESVKHVTIHPEKLEGPLDSEKLSFQLSFTDPTGRKGSLSLPWNPNFIIDPKIIVSTSSVRK